MSEVCTDNRFEIIGKAKADLIESTNIETSKDEMSCLDSFLMRCWQMGWLKKYEKPSIEEFLLKEDRNELTKDEAYAVAEFIDMNIFGSIRNDEDWDSLYALRNLIHSYEKCSARSGYVGMTDGGEDDV